MRNRPKNRGVMQGWVFSSTLYLYWRVYGNAVNKRDNNKGH